MRRIAGVVVAALACAAGALAAEADGVKAEAKAFTLGRVQKELRQGLSQADVVLRLGSPNILTRDASGHEAWVYDRVFTEREVSSSGVGVGGAGMGGGDSFVAGGAIHAGRQTRKDRSSQRTLTVVVRFNSDGLVESFSWHDSRF